MTVHAGQAPATHDRGKHETRSTEDLVRIAHRLPQLGHLSPAKVSKMVRHYLRYAALHETPFEVWAVNVVTCPPETPRPLRNAWGIVDPTGETVARRLSPAGGGQIAQA